MQHYAYVTWMVYVCMHIAGEIHNFNWFVSEIEISDGEIQFQKQCENQS